MVAMVTTAMAGNLVASTTDTPVYFKLKNANGNYVKADAVDGDVSTAGKFAFYAVDGTENAYYIYSADAGKWLNYAMAGSYSNCKNFISLSDEMGNYFYFAECTNTGKGVSGYQIAPYNTNGPAQKYLNYFQGADDSSKLGLWQGDGAGDSGSCWILEEWVDVQEIESEPLTTEYYYNIKNRNSGKFLSVSGDYAAIANEANGEAQLWALVEKDGKYMLKNKTGVYVKHNTNSNQKWTVSSSEPSTFTIGIQAKATTAPTPAYYYISYNTSDLYACMHEAGWSESERVVKWLAEAASSQWEFVKTEVETEVTTLCDVTYVFKYGDKELASQTQSVISGSEYPAFNVTLPLGYSIAEEKPAGAVEATTTEEITVVVDNSLLPFEAVAEGTPTTWYYAQMHAFGGYQWFVAPTEDGSIATANHKFAASEVEAHLWGFVGTVEAGFKMVNKATVEAIKSDNSGVAAMASVEEATAFIAMGSQAGGKWFCLRYPEGDYLNSQSNVINHWWDNDNGSSFLLTEYVAEDVTVNVSEARWATKYFGESVHVPAGVEAYIITGAADGYVTKEQIAEGEVIPANTGVLLYSEEAAEYAFAKTVSYNYTLEGNLLNGSVEDTYVEGVAYVLANHSEEGLGFYKADLNKNATGGEGDTHFLNNAGKAYLVFPASSETVAFYGLDWAGTTGIENVEVESASNVIYDLTGRRVEVAERGIYIINGKKVLVK